MYLIKAKELLENEYKNKYAKTVNEHQKDFMNEKIKHSYQVLGAGNFLINHEECLANYNKDYLQAIVLLHDVARFCEILEIYKGNKVDHGVLGAEMLSMITEFSQIEVLLPIKHHGHLIEKLYEDSEYRVLADNEKNRVRDIAFLVRDADKLANFYLLATKFSEIREIFFSGEEFGGSKDKTPSNEMLRLFENHKSIDRSLVSNLADKALFFLTWIFDLNYKSSFVFMQRLNIIEKLIENFSIFWNDEDIKKYKSIIDDYIRERIK